MDLLEMLQKPESKSLEFKRDLSSPDGILRTIISFANTAGGTLLIGVEDKTRRLRSLENCLDQEERLASLISDSIVPRLMPDLEILSHRKVQILAVHVYPSSQRPHHFKREGEEGGTYVRVGSTNRKGDREMRDEMRRLSRGESFDEQALPDLSSEALDFRVLSELFRNIRPLKPKDMESLRLLVKHQGKKVPSVAGLLICGKERLERFPDSWIQAGRFDGEKKSVLLDQREIRGTLVSGIEDAMDFIRKHLWQGQTFEGLHRRDTLTVPAVALREALINAVAHADYSQTGAPFRISIFEDRLEIENPGLLPLGMTVEDLPQGVSKLRNRVLARVFKEIGLVEQWGSGIQRMQAACLDAGLPEPGFEEIGTRFRVTFGLKPTRTPRIDDVAKGILQALQSNRKGLSTQELADSIGLSTRATRLRLIKLVNQGLVKERGTSRQDPTRRYFPGRS
ncbi:MAG TPA: helix-turn-helix domain-containing protein [Fibrobacteria bacterium]|nr:helix-turn-helix domain-containing protein [Fibrobacteria bacterium]